MSFDTCQLKYDSLACPFLKLPYILAMSKPLTSHLIYLVCKLLLASFHSGKHLPSSVFFLFFFFLSSSNRIEYEQLNLGWLQQLVDSGRIDPAQTITMHTLQECGAVTNVKHGVKLLADVSHCVCVCVCVCVCMLGYH